MPDQPPAPPPGQPTNIIAALAALLFCQLAGETIAVGLRFALPTIAFPGPVLGMAILFIVLVIRGGPGAGLDATSGTILRNLSLLFVPAAVGIMQYGPLIARHGLGLIVALVVSTLLTMLVTVGVFLAVARSADGKDAT